MIVGYAPGGTIRNARVVLKTDETLPNRFNVYGTVVYREGPDNPGVWVLVKAKETVLPKDSPLLSEPEIDVAKITAEEAVQETFEHIDIIRLDEEEK
jgi:hypothetical protein